MAQTHSLDVVGPEWIREQCIGNKLVRTLLAPYSSFLYSACEKNQGGRVVLARFRHPALDLGGSRFGKESRYDVTWRRFLQADRDESERGAVGETCEGVLGTRGERRKEVNSASADRRLHSHLLDGAYSVSALSEPLALRCPLTLRRARDVLSATQMSHYSVVGV